jgi:parallel beta-helix repeat protein
MDPGGLPHYFGPYANYANSPVPKGTISGVTVDNGGSGYTAPVVNITDVWGTGSGATATASVTNGIITSIILTFGGSGYSAPIVTISDPTGTGAAASALMNGSLTGGIRKFIDSLPGLGEANANNLGKYISIAIPDIVTYPGCDYYEIALVRYTEKMHTDLPMTLLNGYVQLETPANAGVSKHIALTYPNATAILNVTSVPVFAVDNPSYLGPTIVATRDIPTRIKFTNYLPTGSGGNLFLPVDKTVMGAGMGPLDMMGMPGMKENYTENRATIHLHGGATPWISDGTPHQWTTPAGENTQYPKGVSVEYVPDMWFVNGNVVPNTVGITTQPVANATTNPGSGSLTFYYTNQQSARLMFYHDHAYGITRLNVYSGEAAPYLLTDPEENKLIDEGIIPSQGGAYLYGIPLVIQDKIFVDASTIAYQDPTWAWGSTPTTPHTGDLWMPHVYMPNQNPYDPSGANPYGRWDYGPWFFPPTPITNGPIANPYYDPINAPWEPLMIPGVPKVSMGMEAFGDTPLVNGQAYPYLNVDPQAYRFRILNAANDRFFNLQLYVADSNVVTVDGRMDTEVKMVPAITTPGFPALWPSDGRAGGVPDPANIGPSFIQIGNEGGFLPAPTVIQNQPVTFNYNPKTFTYGNVQDHSLLLGSAERADVIIDFSQYAGKTLILYNDAPAGFPANDPRNDYYTGAADQTFDGGAPTTHAGYGPNTRTIMQIRVANIMPAPTYNVNALMAAWASTANHTGVFETSQDPVIVPQARYDSAYNLSFPTDAYVRIQDTNITFKTIANTTLTIQLQPKAIHDEMGGAYDTVYGRMSGLLGIEVPSGNAVTQMFMPLGYASPPVDILTDTITPMSPIAGDGTQIWKITHNGVDTHAFHWHLFNVQLINRVGWDGAIMFPDDNELGWKETVRVDPLSDTIVAIRPYAPILPWEVPTSNRLIDPTMPAGDLLLPPPGGFMDPSGTTLTGVTNHLVNYGWEYVMHCHLLEHEEMDMMHAMPFATAPYSPTNLGATMFNATSVNLTWMDASIAETGYIVQRNTTLLPWTDLAVIPSPLNTTGPTNGTMMSYNDTIVADGTIYYYRILANTIVGDGLTAGYPTFSVNSTPSNMIFVDSGTSSVTVLPGPAPRPTPPVPPPAAPITGSYGGASASLVSLASSQAGTMPSRASHAPIRINSNADFDVAHGVTPGGSGTIVSPWVIENYDINGSGYGYDIYIGNTTDYFMVKNCNLHNAIGGVFNWRYSPESGIVLFNVMNGIIVNSAMSANGWSGAYLLDSQGIAVYNNTASKNNIGLYVSSTSGCTIAFNTLSQNFAGLWLYGSNSTMVVNNTVQRNYPGMLLAASNYITLANNTASLNIEYGAWMHSSNRNRVYDNDFRENNGANSIFNASHIQAYDDTGTNYWNGTASGNYWSDWTAPDVAPLNGIVDVPYLIAGGAGAMDSYPRTTPVMLDHLTTILVAPATVNVAPGGAQAFSAQAYNQFGNMMTGVTFTWATNVGSMTGSTLTAQTVAGVTGYVRATSGIISGDSVVTVGFGPLDHINVAPSALNITPGMPQQFVATGKDAYNNTITGLTFVWTTNVGTVNSAGLFVAQSTAGASGYVNASSGGKTGSAAVIVIPGVLTHIIVTPLTVDVQAGTAQSFTAVGYDQYNNTVTGLTFAWTTNVGAMVGTALMAQTTSGTIGYVRATSGAVSAEAIVTITPRTLDHIDVAPSGLNVVAGSQTQFVATGKDIYNNTITSLSFVWNTTVGTISGAGLLTAQNVAGASGFVNASNGGKIGSASVTVITDQLTHIVVSPSVVNVIAGTTQSFSAVGYDQYNNTISGLTITWTTDVGAMTGTTLTAQIASGVSGYVRATSGAVFGSSSVSIVPATLNHIVISPITLIAVAGTQIQYTAVGQDVYNNNISGLTIVWTTTVGSVSGSGLFTAQILAGGVGYVNATIGLVKGSSGVTIVPDQLTHIVVSPGTVNVIAGTTQGFSAVGYDRFNNSISGLTFIWTTDIGTLIGSTLTAPTIAASTGHVSVKVGSVNGTASVTIVPAALDHVYFYPTLLNATAGKATQFTAVGKDVYNNTITGLTFVWATTVGSVTSSGLFTAQTVAGASGTVTATTGGKTGSASVSIRPDQLTHILVMPAIANISANSTQVFAATCYDQYDNVISGLTLAWSTNIGTMVNASFTAQTVAGVSGYVRASSGTVSGNAFVNVVTAPLDHIDVSPLVTSMVAGTQMGFTATAKDVYNNTISGVTFNWTSTLGIIDGSGLFTAPTKAGVSVTIDVTIGNVTKSTGIAIVPDQLTHIIITPDNATVIAGKIQNYTAVGYDQYENAISGLTFIWSTDVGIFIGATFTAQNESGVIGYVKVTSGLVSGYTPVTIAPPPSDLLLIILVVLTIALIAIAVVVYLRRGQGGSPEVLPKAAPKTPPKTEDSKPKANVSEPRLRIQRVVKKP